MFYLFYENTKCQREIWSWIYSESRGVKRETHNSSIVRAEMFGQLTSGLEAAWNKLKGEGVYTSFFFIFKRMNCLVIVVIIRGLPWMPAVKVVMLVILI